MGGGTQDRSESDSRGAGYSAERIATIERAVERELDDRGAEPIKPSAEALERIAAERRGHSELLPAACFDHTLLRPEATKADLAGLCEEARSLHTATVCVAPDRVREAAELLRDSPVDVCTVVGFPLGYQCSSVKALEVREAAAAGCFEYDTVIPIGRLRDGDPTAVYDDVRAVVETAGSGLVKVIVETCYLEEEEKVRAAVSAFRAGAAYVKTSTGFGSAGATEHDVALLRRLAGSERGVKAAGGIRSTDFAVTLRQAGADRIGASRTVTILAEFRRRRDQTASSGGADGS